MFSNLAARSEASKPLTIVNYSTDFVMAFVFAYCTYRKLSSIVPISRAADTEYLALFTLLHIISQLVIIFSIASYFNGFDFTLVPHFHPLPPFYFIFFLPEESTILSQTSLNSVYLIWHSLNTPVCGK